MYLYLYARRRGYMFSFSQCVRPNQSPWASWGERPKQAIKWGWLRGPCTAQNRPERAALLFYRELSCPLNSFPSKLATSSDIRCLFSDSKASIHRRRSNYSQRQLLGVGRAAGAPDQYVPHCSLQFQLGWAVIVKTPQSAVLIHSYRSASTLPYRGLLP